MAASDAIPVPRKGVAYRQYFSVRKNDGSLITSWAGQDSEVSLDGGAYSDCTNEATEIGTSGTGYIDLTSSEMNADSLMYKLTVTNTDALTLVLNIVPESAGDYRCDAVMLSGDTTAADNAEAFFDGTGYAGTNNVIPLVTTVTTLTNLPAITANWLTAAGIAASALDDKGNWLKPTTAGRTLDVTAGGCAGLDWANVEAPTTAVGLTGTTISTSQVVASVSGAVGSVTGAVGSVTGAVGSVTGAVGSVTGNVGGNVVGSVASVVGAVGSVTGNVGGNVVGSVASVVGNIGGDLAGTVANVTNLTNAPSNGDLTATMKTSVNTEVAAAIVTYGLDHLLFTSVANGDVANSSVFARIASKSITASWASYDNTSDSLQAISDTSTASAIADAVWDEPATDHATAGTFGAYVGTINTNVATLISRITSSLFGGITSLGQWLGLIAGKQTPDSTALAEIKATGAGSGTYDATTDSLESQKDSGGGGASAADVADAVCDELLSGHTIPGSVGAALAAASSAGDPWATPVPGAYAVGTAGYIIGNNLDTPVGDIEITPQFTPSTAYQNPTVSGNLIRVYAQSTETVLVTVRDSTGATVDFTAISGDLEIVVEERFENANKAPLEVMTVVEANITRTTTGFQFAVPATTTFITERLNEKAYYWSIRGATNKIVRGEGRFEVAFAAYKN